MINKFILIFTLLLLQSTNTTFATHFLRSETCLSVDKIKHIPGSRWQLSDDSSEWNVFKEDTDSNLQFSIDTPVKRRVEPYHNPIARKLAIVTCQYAGDTLVLQRIYEQGFSPYADVNYISADSNVDINGNFASGFFNNSTSCLTTVGAIEKCPWFFFQEGSKDVPYGFYGAHGWL